MVSQTVFRRNSAIRRGASVRAVQVRQYSRLRHIDHSECGTRCLPSIEDGRAIRRQPIQCAVLRVTPGSDDTTAREFYVLLWHHLDVSPLDLCSSLTGAHLTRIQRRLYENTLLSLLRGDARLGFAFGEPPADPTQDLAYSRARQIPLGKWWSSGADFAMAIKRPNPTDPGQDVRTGPIEAFDTYHEANKS